MTAPNPTAASASAPLLSSSTRPARASGAGPTPLPPAFSLFRAAVILDGSAARALAGNAAAENAVEVGRMAESFADRAWAVIESED